MFSDFMYSTNQNKNKTKEKNTHIQSFNVDYVCLNFGKSFQFGNKIDFEPNIVTQMNNNNNPTIIMHKNKSFFKKKKSLHFLQAPGKISKNSAFN